MSKTNKTPSPFTASTTPANSNAVQHASKKPNNNMAV
jgi:hypothetical protein